MPLTYLTIEQHQQLLHRLVSLARQFNGTKYHHAGASYTSLMVCFFLHNLSASETLLRLAKSFGNEWFPVTIGYILDRSIFEVIIKAHYITKDPLNRARQYIDYGHVIRKNHLDTLLKHHNTQDATWHDLIDLTLEHEWSSRAQKINEKYKSVKRQFETTTKRGKKRIFQNWSGKSIREMAKEVEHEVEYDVFYSELSSFTHADVELADRFLRIRPDGPSWTQRANEFDVGNVFRYAATFFSCFLQLFGREFNVWTEQDVSNCWKFRTDMP